MGHCEKLESERATLLENRAVLAAEKTQLAAAHQGSGDLIVTLRSEISELRQENQHLDETNFQNVKTLTRAEFFHPKLKSKELITWS